MDDVEPRPFLWTKDAYYQASEAGLFLEHRVQLIEGEIVEMAAQKNSHALGIKAMEHALILAFGANYWVRVQMSIDLTPRSVSDPDLAVIAGTWQSHLGSIDNPTSALLIVEVSDTTLSFDRNAKASLYAVSGIADYWIVNLVNGQLEIYRDPQPNARARFGWAYASRTDLLPGATVAPLVLPGASIAVADLIP